MSDSGKDAALRKRQQIDSSKRSMFIVVAIVAFVSGIALVVSYFLVQQIILHAKVVGEKQKAVNTIAANMESVGKLKDNIRVLDTNEALMSARSKEDSSALQVVLDSLPTEANTDALGASLQVSLIGPIDGITLERMSIEEAASTSGSDSVSSSGESSSHGIGFSLSVSGSAEGMKALLARFERSIRVIKIDSIEIVGAGEGRLTMSLLGRAYYQPGKTVEVGSKVVKL